jgi:hypothetical protein
MQATLKKFWQDNQSLLVVTILLIAIIFTISFNRNALLTNDEGQEIITANKENHWELAYQIKPEDYLIAPQTVFSLQISPDQETNLSVYRLEILFDPNLLSVEAVEAGEYFTSPKILRNKINNQEGKIDFSIGIGPQENQDRVELQSQNSFLIISFKVKSLIAEELSATTISFGPNTSFISKEEVLKNSAQVLEPIILESIHE